MQISQYDYFLNLRIILFEPDQGLLKIKQKDFKTEGKQGHCSLFSDYLLSIFPAFWQLAILGLIIAFSKKMYFLYL